MNSSSRDASRSNTDRAGYGRQPTGTIGIGSTEQRGDLVLHRQSASPARHDDPRRLAGGQPGIGGVRDDVEIDAGADHHGRRHPVDRRRWRRTGRRILDVGVPRATADRLRSRRTPRSAPGPRSARRAGHGSGPSGSTGDRAAPARRCGATVATNSASASTVGTSPCSIWNASRSCWPMPTSNRGAPVCGSVTTRHTSSPRTSPTSTPCSTDRSRAAGDDQLAELVVLGGERPAVRHRLGDGRQQCALGDVPHLDRQSKGGGPAGEDTGARLGRRAGRSLRGGSPRRAPDRDPAAAARRATPSRCDPAVAAAPRANGAGARPRWSPS